MNLVTLLEMARSATPDRIAIGRRADGLTFERLARLAANGAARIAERGSSCLVFIGVNGPAWPVCLYSAAAAGVPVVPLNYRLAIDRLAALVGRFDTPLVVADARYLDDLAAVGVPAIESAAWLAELAGAGEQELPEQDETDGVAVVLFTSGTTSEPKGVVLRHSNLSAYVIQTVEFASADEDDAALVSVPPYHVAGVGTVLTNGYAGRRLVYLPDFTAAAWLDIVRTEGITQAMVVPTMLARVLDELAGKPADVPTLRAIAYGGAPMPRTVLERALAAFPDTDFVNSYGLTETSSTIAVLGPDEHRASFASTEPAVVARLGSVGRPVPGVEIVVRGEEGEEVPVGATGLLWVRGPQVATEYLGQGRSTDAAGWFPTRDRGYLDADGYLYVLGRADDTIIRGGENIAPEEVESALRQHPAVSDVGVVGAPDAEWGQRIVAAVVTRPGASIDPDELRSWTRERLRGSRTPDDVVFVGELPYNPLGKLVRRDLELMVASPSTGEE